MRLCGGREGWRREFYIILIGKRERDRGSGSRGWSFRPSSGQRYHCCEIFGERNSNAIELTLLFIILHRHPVFSKCPTDSTETKPARFLHADFFVNTPMMIITIRVSVNVFNTSVAFGFKPRSRSRPINFCFVDDSK